MCEEQSDRSRTLSLCEKDIKSKKSKTDDTSGCLTLMERICRLGSVKIGSGDVDDWGGDDDNWGGDDDDWGGDNDDVRVGDDEWCSNGEISFFSA